MARLLETPWAPIGMAVLGATVSCDAVLGIEQYGPGSSEDGGAQDATTDSGSSSGAESGSSSGAESGSDSAADGTTEAGGCTPGAMQCAGNGVQTCQADGQWGSAVACVSTTPSCRMGICGQPVSCAPGGAGMTNCGSGGNGGVSCCASQRMLGGKFDRGYDAVTFTDNTHPATISSLRLDKYEVTVGRFRQFVGAVDGGWLPAAGSGKHTHLNGGQGLAATGGGYETGWDSAWTGTLGTTSSRWTSNLSCDAIHQTWTALAGNNENKPINCETWSEAYAFCIWDGGFLPSDAERNYAAAGGGGSSGQRVYPWSSPSTIALFDCAHANYAGCMAAAPNNVGSESPAGDGAYGQADLAGNLWDWNLDWYATAYVDPCADCANLTAGPGRVMRGGSFANTSSDMLAANRNEDTATSRGNYHGVRCARVP